MLLPYCIRQFRIAASSIVSKQQQHYCSIFGSTATTTTTTASISTKLYSSSTEEDNQNNNQKYLASSVSKMAFNEDSSASGHDEPWIQWFCGLRGHEMFCEVERSYIEDGFNLYGLRTCVANFSDCLDLILDRIGPDDDSDDSHLTQSACTLYGLIHARYIITAHGLDAMYTKYAAKEFGTCPLVQCQGQPVLPVSLNDEMGVDTVKIYCPKCSQVYHPPSTRTRAGNAAGVDGAAFGTTFPHLFLMTFPNLVPDPLPTGSAYIPRIFGFRIHKSARQSPAGGGTAATTADATTISATLPPAPVAADANEKTSASEDEVKPAPAILHNMVKDGNPNVLENFKAGGSGVDIPNAINIGDEKRSRSNNNNNNNKRRKEGPNAVADGSASVPSGSSGGQISATLKKEANGTVGPTFLLENAAKRRRRNNNST